MPTRPLAVLVTLAAAGIAGCAPGPRPDPQAAATPEPGGITPGFRSRHSLNLAIALQRLPEADRLEELRRLARPGPRSPEVFVLCRLLLEPRPNAGFPRPLLGSPIIIGTPNDRPLPLEPIELRDGVPILVVRGYELAGIPTTPAADLDACLHACRWRSTPLEPRTEGQILAAISGLIHDLHATGDEATFLLAQADEPSTPP